jgi:menaquinone-dependent protoporphyrinogen oxidase
MRALIAYTSKHGSTREIAERIGATLRSAGDEAQVIPVSAAPDPLEFDRVIVGSAVYMGHWMKEAVEFVRLNRAKLAERPLWLFSSGPVGPRSLPEAVDIAALRQLLEIRGHRTFAGALDAKKLSLAERMMVRAVKAQYGDDRSWEDIDTWAREIADALLPERA